MTNQDGTAHYVTEADEVPAALPASVWGIASFVAGWIALAAFTLPAVGIAVAAAGIAFGHLSRREVKAGERQDWQRVGIAGLVLCYFVLALTVVALIGRARRGA